MWEGERQQADRGLHHALPGPRGPSSEDVTDLSRAVFQGFQLKNLPKQTQRCL